MARNWFTFTAEVWKHEGTGGWHFVSLPAEVADEIEETHGQRARGFRSLRVDVTIGATRWATSIFPDTKRGTYVLPVKRAVRVAEDLSAGSIAHVRLVVGLTSPRNPLTVDNRRLPAGPHLRADLRDPQRRLDRGRTAADDLSSPERERRRPAQHRIGVAHHLTGE